MEYITQGGYRPTPPSTSGMPGPSMSYGMAGPSMSYGMAGTSTSYDIPVPSAERFNMPDPSMQHVPDMFQTPVQNPHVPDAEGRPRRVVGVGQQLQAPFTALPATTPPASPPASPPAARRRANPRGRANPKGGRRGRVQGRVQEERQPEELEVLRVASTTGFPPRSRIPFLEIDLTPSWWTTLLGQHGDQGIYLHTVSLIVLITWLVIIRSSCLIFFVFIIACRCVG